MYGLGFTKGNETVRNVWTDNKNKVVGFPYLVDVLMSVVSHSSGRKFALVSPSNKMVVRNMMHVADLLRGEESQLLLSVFHSWNSAP